MLKVLLGLVVLGAIGVIVRRRRERERMRRLGHTQKLRSMLQQARSGDIEPLRRHAYACHENGPGPAAAEAWYTLGCALLDSQKPEEATRAFQLACHAHAGLASAVLLAFTCLKTRATDMPDFLRLLLETHAEIGRPSFPGRPWEHRLLGGLHTPDSSQPGLSDLARSLTFLPIRCLREQIREAVQRRPGWAAPLLNTAKGQVTTALTSARAERSTRAARTP